MQNGVFLNFWRTDGTAYFPGAAPPGPDIYDNVLKSKGGLQLKNSFHKRIRPITIRRHYDTAINQNGVTIRASYVVENSSN